MSSTFASASTSSSTDSCWLNNCKIQVNPVQSLIDRLEIKFGGLAMFFYNPFGGSFIGVVLKRHIFNETITSSSSNSVDWKPNLAWPILSSSDSTSSSKKNATAIKVKPNLAFICHEMVRLGDGLVTCVSTLQF